MAMSKYFAVGALGLSVFATSAQALTFDPDGNAGTSNDIEITALDWDVSTFTAQNGTEAIRNFANSGGTCPVAGECVMTVYSQTVLSSFRDENGPLAVTGLNDTGAGAGGFEYTMTMSFDEEVVFVSAQNPVTNGVTATFDVVTGNPVNVEIFYDSTIDDGSSADPLTGFGYTDGDLILRASLVQNSFGEFTAILDGTTANLDQSPTPADDDYDGQQTILGGGSQLQNIVFGGIEQDNAFFKDLLADFGINVENVSLILPFGGVDPADCMINSASTQGVGDSGQVAGFGCDNLHANANMAGQSAPVDGRGFVPNIGDVNGFAFDPTGVRGDDFMAQTDFNMPLDTQGVPLPGSLVLLGTGLSALGFFGGTRRRREEA